MMPHETAAFLRLAEGLAFLDAEQVDLCVGLASLAVGAEAGGGGEAAGADRRPRQRRVARGLAEHRVRGLDHG
ncbi:MAG: hypothetical protein ACK4JA_06200, partial [Parazoarcus communis]